MAFTKLEPKSVNTSATFTFANVNITGNLDVNQGINLGSVENVTINGGTAGQVLSTDGTGNLSWADGGTGSSVVVSGFTGITQDTFTGDGSEINFTLSTTPDSRDFVYVNIDGITQQRSAFDITDDVITFTEAPLSGEIIEVTTYLAHGQTTAGSNTQVQYNNNGNLGGSPNFTFNSATGVLQASFLKGDGYQIGNIRAANIYGEVPSSHMAGTVFMNAQPNITSVGTLTGLTVDGNVTATRFIGDGSQLTGISAGSSAPAGTNTQVQFNDNGTTAGNSALTFNKTTGTLSATKFVGDGSLLTGVVSDLTGYATQTYVNTQISNLVDAAPSTLNTLNELAAALGDDANFSTTVTNTLANKLNANAFTYANITGKPTLFSGSYTDLTNKPTLFSGSYTDLTNKPSIPTDISNLTDTNNLLGASALNDLTDVVINSGTLESGQVLKYDGTNWVNGTDATSGTGGGTGGVTSYIDLTDKPFIPLDVSDLTDTTNLLISSYNELTDKPTLGTAAATSSTDYATAAQGTKADSAVQPGDNVSDLTNDAGYATESFVTSQGYITSSSLTPYATKTYVDTAIADIPATDLTNYTTKTYVDTAIAAIPSTDLTGYATESYVDTAIASVPGADLTGYATQTYVNTQISNLVDAAPTALNTLNELASALGDDPNFATSIATTIGSKLSTSDFNTTANTWFGTQASTTSLAEGTNLYYTVARANTAINARVTKSFVDALGVVASTVTASAQPSITSVGTLTGLTVSGLITATGSGIKTGNIIDSGGTTAITTKYNNENGSVGITANLSAGGNITGSYILGNGSQLTGMYSNTNVANYLPTYTGVVTAGSIKTNSLLYANGDPWSLGGGTASSVDAANVTGTFTSLNVSDAANINIGGGVEGQLLTVDGTGNLLWIDPQQGGSGGSYIINGTSNVYIEPNGNIKFAVGGVADTLVMSSTTMTYTGNIISGSGTGGNIAGANVITANTIISQQLQGNGSSITDINGANVSGQVSNSLVTGTVYTNAQPNINSVGTLVDLTVTGLVDAGSLSGEGGNISNIFGGNVTGSVGAATTAGTVTTAAQPNITSTGTLTELTVNGNVSVVGANISLGTAANLHILGGQPGYVLSTDGTGNLGWAAGAGSSGGTAISKNYYWQGTVQVNTGTQRLYMPSDATLTNFYMNLGTAGNTDTTISIKKNGTQIRTATLTAGAASLLTIAGDALSANDYLTVDITVAGASAVDLYVTFLLTI